MNPGETTGKGMHPLIGRTVTTRDTDGTTTKGTVIDVTCSAKGLSGFLLELEDGRMFDTAAYQCRLLPDTLEWQTSEAERGDVPMVCAPEGMEPATRWEPFGVGETPPCDASWVIWRRMIRPTD